MSHKYFIFTLLVLFLICLSTLVYPSGASANGGALTLELDPPAKWKTWRPKKNTVLLFTANVLGDTTTVNMTTVGTDGRTCLQQVAPALPILSQD